MSKYSADISTRIGRKTRKNIILLSGKHLCKSYERGEMPPWLEISRLKWCSDFDEIKTSSLKILSSLNKWALLEKNYIYYLIKMCSWVFSNFHSVRVPCQCISTIFHVKLLSTWKLVLLEISLHSLVSSFSQIQFYPNWTNCQSAVKFY